MKVIELVNQLRQLILEHPNTSEAELELVVQGADLDDGSHETVHAELRKVNYHNDIIKWGGPIQLVDR